MWTGQVPDGNVTAVAFAPDGETLYTQDSAKWYTAWNLAARTGDRLFRTPDRIGETRAVSNHFPRIFISPDGRHLISNTSPAIVWDLVGRDTHAVVPDEYAFAGVSAGVGRVECVASDWLGIRSWDFARKKPGPEYRDWPVPGTIKTHHFAPDGRRVALLDWNDAATVCDVATRAVIQRVVLPGRQLQHCRFAPDGETLVMYAGDGIAVWDLPSRRVRVDRVECDRPYWMLAYHPTQPLVAARRRDGLLALIDLRTGGEVRVLDPGLGTQLTCAEFSPDGLTCAVGGSDNRLALFDVDA